MPLFLSVEQIVDIHRSVTRRYGGDPRVRDWSLLGSAALAPQETRFGEMINKSLRSQAATYWLSVGLNRPFLENNDRTALVVCEVFLEVNGFELDIGAKAIHELMDRVSTRQIFTKEKFLQGFRIKPSLFHAPYFPGESGAPSIES